MDDKSDHGRVKTDVAVALGADKMNFGLHNIPALPCICSLYL